MQVHSLRHRRQKRLQPSAQQAEAQQPFRSSKEIGQVVTGYSAEIANAYKSGCLKAAERLRQALNEFDATYTSGAKIAQGLPQAFTDTYMSVIGARTSLRMFIAQCRQPL